MPTKPTLLITEDDIDLREALVETLSHLPIQIIEAENGKVGFDRAMKDKPTAILSDINMPEMTGLQFLAEYRAWGGRAPFVILSAFADRNNTVAALRLGAYDFLAKPFEAEELEKVIMNAIETGERIQEVEMLYQRLVSQGNVDVAELKKVMDAKLEVELLKIQHHHMSKTKKAG